MREHFRSLLVMFALCVVLATCSASSTTVQAEGVSAASGGTDATVTGPESTESAPMPTGTPATAPEPTSTVAPEVDPTPTTPTGTSVEDDPKPIERADRGAFDDDRARAVQIIDDASSLRIDEQTTIRFADGSSDRVDLNIVSDVDRVNDIGSVVLTFGADAGLLTDERFEYIDAGGSLFFRLQSDDETSPWVDLTTAEGVDPASLAGASAVLKAAAVSGFIEALDPARLAEVIEGGGGQGPRYRVEIDNSLAVQFMPADTFEAMFSQGLTETDLKGTTDVIFSLGPVAIEADLDLTPVAREIGTLGAGQSMPATASRLHEVRVELAEVEIEIPDLSEIDDAESPSAPPGAGVGPVAPGQCLAEPDLFQPRLDCNDSHSVEIFDVFDLPDERGVVYPGDDEVFASGVEGCEATFVDEFGVASDLTVVELFVFYPLDAGWRFGDREIVCALVFPESVDRPLVELDPMRIGSSLSVYGYTAGICIADKFLFDSDRYTVVDCASSHGFEAIADTLVADGAFPGDDALFTQADEFCNARFEELIGVSYAESVWFMDLLYPNDYSWERGDRLITCVVSQVDATEGTAIGSGI